MYVVSRVAGGGGAGGGGWRALPPRSIAALTSEHGGAPLARPALLNKPPSGVAPSSRRGHSTAARGGPAPRTRSPPAMADMPDLSHLTPEERAIIEGVMMRQRQEEQREHEIMRCARAPRQPATRAPPVCSSHIRRTAPLLFVKVP